MGSLKMFPEKFSNVLALIKSNTPIFEVVLLQNGGDGTLVAIRCYIKCRSKDSPSPIAQELSQQMNEK